MRAAPAEGSCSPPCCRSTPVHQPADLAGAQQQQPEGQQVAHQPYTALAGSCLQLARLRSQPRLGWSRAHPTAHLPSRRARRRPALHRPAPQPCQARPCSSPVSLPGRPGPPACARACLIRHCPHFAAAWPRAGPYRYQVARATAAEPTSGSSDAMLARLSCCTDEAASDACTTSGASLFQAAISAGLCSRQLSHSFEAKHDAALQACCYQVGR